jgi:hypothetical protein
MTMMIIASMMMMTIAMMMMTMKDAGKSPNLGMRSICTWWHLESPEELLFCNPLEVPS